MVAFMKLTVAMGANFMSLLLLFYNSSTREAIIFLLGIKAVASLDVIFTEGLKLNTTAIELLISHKINSHCYHDKHK